MPYKLRPAQRSESKVTGALFGKSGCGKTFTLLTMARGIAGPKGRIAMADTEGGRGELLSDVPEIGGYEYLEIRPPFTVQAYLDAIETFEREKIDVGVIDSMSHVWEGEGGTIDQARANEKRTGKAGLHNWNKPKQDLNRLVLKIIQTRVHLLFGLRAKRKSHQVDVVENGQRKTKVARDGFYTPKMDDEFISELVFCAEQIGIDDARGPHHSLIVHKTTHPKIGEFFKDGIIPTLRTGQLFAAWSKNDSFKVPAADQKPASQVVRREAPIVEDRYEGAEDPDADKRPAPADDGKPSYETWEPPVGWPEFDKVGPWATWSIETFLPSAQRLHAEAWMHNWSHFYRGLEKLAAGKNADAVKALAAIKSLQSAAMKRQEK